MNKQNKIKPRLIDTEDILLVARGQGFDGGKMGKGDQEVQTKSFYNTSVYNTNLL